MTDVLKNNECYRIGNTVGPRLKDKLKNDPKDCGINVLKALEKGERKTRVLLDYFTATITPKISKNGWDIKENISSDDINKFGRYDFKPNGKIKELKHDEFFDLFIELFDDLFDFSKKYEENKGGGHNGAYNYGRVYNIGKTNAKVHFRSFNPDNSKPDKEYVLGPPHNQFVHQKVMIDLSGDAIQYLRSKNNLLIFILRLYKVFPTTPTKFDIAIDFFNYNLKPGYFAELYKADYYTGLSKVNGNGDFKEPTVYIGGYKKNETVMLYDKILESKDTGQSDEPELLKVLEDNDGDWFRLEQHYSNDKRSAEEAFGFIVYSLLKDYTSIYNLNSRFSELLSSLLYDRLTAPRKPRFLSQKRKERNNVRIKTDDKWQMILDEIEKVDIDFSYARPELSLMDRMDNFKYRSLGGKILYQDIIDELGEDALIRFMNDVAMYHIELKKREDSEN